MDREPMVSVEAVQERAQEILVETVLPAREQGKKSVLFVKEKK